MRRAILFVAFLLPVSILSAQDQDYYKEEVRKFRKELVESAMEYPENPPLTKKDTPHLDYFSLDSNFIILADFQALPKDTFVNIPTSAGTEKIFKILGTAHFTLNDTAETLTIYQPLSNGLQPYLFVPFKDATSGLSTYGGGRYLDIELEHFSREDQTLLLDFNKAYNPWCAYRSGYFCPLPPEENALQITINAGEKEFIKE